MESTDSNLELRRNRPYFIEKNETGMAEVKSIFNGILLTHFDNPYPSLPIELAEILCEDLNEINNRNSAKQGKSTKVEAVIERLSNEYLANECRESLSYCLISTLIERQKNEYKSDNEVKIAPRIHWDRIFRINPQPPLLQNELAIADAIKPLLSSKWEDLPLNYAYTVKEMEEEEATFVSNEIIAELKEKSKSFDETDTFVVDLLFHYIDSISIVLPILWTGKIISSETFIDGFRVFGLEQPINPKSAKQKEERKYFIQRMEYLRNTMNQIKKQPI